MLPGAQSAGLRRGSPDAMAIHLTGCTWAVCVVVGSRSDAWLRQSVHLSALNLGRWFIRQRPALLQLCFLRVWENKALHSGPDTLNKPFLTLKQKI